MCILEALSYLAIIIASLTAIFGINSWRREFREKRKIELAEEVLALFYEACDKIRIIRHPFSFSKKDSSMEQDEKEKTSQERIRDISYVPIERYQENIQLFNKLRAIRYRVMAQFGKEAAKPFNDLKAVLDDIFLASTMLNSLWSTDPNSYKTTEQEVKHFELIEKYKKVIWGMLYEDDPINPRLDQMIKDIDDICEPTLSYKSDFKIKFITSLFEKLKRKGK